MPSLAPTLTISALDKLDGAADVTPFTFGIASHVVTFPDVLAMDAEDTEAFMRDVEPMTGAMAVFKRWLTAEDYQVLRDAHLTGRQATILLREVNRYYQAALGEPGEGSSSSTD